MVALLFVAFRDNDAADGINDVMRAAAASRRIVEIEVHMPAVRFSCDPNDESREVSVGSIRIQAGDTQDFVGTKAVVREEKQCSFCFLSP